MLSWHRFGGYDVAFEIWLGFLGLSVLWLLGPTPFDTTHGTRRALLTLTLVLVPASVTAALILPPPLAMTLTGIYAATRLAPLFAGPNAAAQSVPLFALAVAPLAALPGAGAATAPCLVATFVALLAVKTGAEVLAGHWLCPTVRRKATRPVFAAPGKAKPVPILVGSA